MKLLKVEWFGTQAQGVTLRGDPRSPEPEHLRIVFPGGDVDLVRCDDGSYWAHVRVDGPTDARENPDKVAGRIMDVRVDYRERDRHLDQAHVEAGMSPIAFGEPGPYHLAVRIGKAPR